MTARQIDIRTPDGVADAWLFHPDGAGAWPGVILHTDVRGVRPVFQEMASRLAEHGFTVLLPNIYYRVAKVPPLDPALPPRGDAAKARLEELRGSLTREGTRRDHAAYLDTLASLAEIRRSKRAVVGYCLTGAVALHTAADFPDRIAAAASFHGGRLASDRPDSPHLRAGDIRAEVYLGHATDDASMPRDMIERLETSMTAAHVKFESEIYPARHGFAVSDSPAFDAPSAQRHLDKLLALLRRAL